MKNFILLLIFVSLVFTAYAETEPNNSLTEATVIAPDSSDSGTSTTGDDDWFKITIPDDGSLAFTVICDNPLQVNNLEIYDTNGYISAGSFGTNASVSHNSLAAGTYYLKIRNYISSGTYTVSNSFTPAGLAKETEKNDSSAIAVSLILNDSTTARLNYSGDGHSDLSDWFKVTIPDDGELTFTVNCESTLQVDNLAIYDQDGKTFLMGGSYGQNASVTYNNLSVGTYYLNVKQYIGYGSYYVKNQFTAAAYTNDTEPNDSANTAVSLIVNDSLTGRLYYQENGIKDVVDWFKVTIPDDGKLTFTVSCESTLQVDNLAIYASDGTTLISSGSYGKNASVTYNNLSSGTYYLYIKQYIGYGSYMVKNIFVPATYPSDTEPNNSDSTAVVLSLNDSLTGRLYYRTINQYDSHDWYKVTIPDDGELTFKVKGESTLQVNNLEIYDHDGSTYLLGGSYGQNASVTYNNLSSGTYYLRVAQYIGYGSYIVENIYTPATYAGDPEPNDSIDIASSISHSDSTTGRLHYYNRGVYDDADWFEINTPNNGNLTIDVTCTNTLQIDNLEIYSSDKLTRIVRGSYGVNASAAATNIPKGKYYVKVVRYIGYGSYVVKPIFLPAPTADFIINQDIFNVSFTNTTKLGKTYLWDFGDTTTSTLANPSHKYILPGVYNICLIAANAAGSDTTCSSVSIKGLQSIQMNHAGNLGDATVYVMGGGLTKNTTLTLRRNGYSDITATTLGLESKGALRTLLDLYGQAPGKWDVVVTIPNDTTMVVPGGFTIEDGKPADPWVDIMGRDRILFNRWQTYTIVYGNNGNEDAKGVPFWLVLSDIPGMEVRFEDFEIGLPHAAIDSNWQILDSVPIFFTTDSLSGEAFDARVYPLYIPNIPAGMTRSVKIKVKTPSNIRMMTWVNKPLYHSPMNKQLSDCLWWANMRTSVNGVVGMIPVANCAWSVLNNFWNPFEYDYPEENKPKQTWGSMMRGWASTGLSCASNVVPGSAVLTGLAVQTMGTTLDILDNKSVNDDCHNAFGEKSKKDKPIRAVSSFDPNEIVGPKGYGQENYILKNSSIPYTIYFENKSTATAPAQEVFVYDTIDITKFDAQTFSLGTYGFGDATFTPRTGLKNYTNDIDLTDSMNIILRVTASFDTTSGIATWHLMSLDPLTMDLPEDPDAGFLPPNVTSPEGEGFVSFSIGIFDTLPDNTTFTNQAKIIFDLNKPINTNIYSNTLDISSPSSQVASLNSQIHDTVINLSWSGNDALSGIRNYTLSVAENDSAYKAYLVNTSETSYAFPGKTGSTYKFYTIATDSLGNTEKAPVTPDAQTTVVVGLSQSHIDLINLKVLRLSGNSCIAFECNILQSGPLTFEIININGKKIETLVHYASVPGSQRVIWNTVNIPKGVYFVKMTHPKGNITSKFTL